MKQEISSQNLSQQIRVHLVINLTFTQIGYKKPSVISVFSVRDISYQAVYLFSFTNCSRSFFRSSICSPYFCQLPSFRYFMAELYLGKAMLGINSVKGFEIGSGFRGASMKGSEHNDLFVNDNGIIKTLTNHSGGIQGGISNGEEICFRVAFKPVSTLMKAQQTVNASGEPVIIPGKGRHDVCVVPRALPIVEAMAALVIADHLLRST